MNGTCNGCGIYHEEDDARPCWKCEREARIASCRHELDISPSGRMATCLLCNAMYRSVDGRWERETMETIEARQRDRARLVISDNSKMETQ